MKTGWFLVMLELGLEPRLRLGFGFGLRLRFRLRQSKGECNVWQNMPQPCFKIKPIHSAITDSQLMMEMIKRMIKHMHVSKQHQQLFMQREDKSSLFLACLDNFGLYCVYTSDTPRQSVRWRDPKSTCSGGS